MGDVKAASASFLPFIGCTSHLQKILFTPRKADNTAVDATWGCGLGGRSALLYLPDCPWVSTALSHGLSSHPSPDLCHDASFHCPDHCPGVVSRLAYLNFGLKVPRSSLAARRVFLPEVPSSSEIRDLGPCLLCMDTAWLGSGPHKAGCC